MRGSPTVEKLWHGAIIGIVAVLCATQCARAAPRTAVAVASGVYVIQGTGGAVTRENGGRTANVTFVVGPTGVVVLDTGISYPVGEEIIAAVKAISDRPIRLAIITHPSQEAIFGAAAFQARGIPVLAHRRSAELIAARCETCLRKLRMTLGEDAMAGTRVIEPDRLIDSDQTLQLIGRPLRLISPEGSSAPGALAVFDEWTSTLITGSLVLIDRIPDIADANPKGWHDALARLESTRCRHLVPAYGPIGSCADIASFGRYFAMLERRVEVLVKDGASLAELRERCELPEFARWDQYETLHPRNAQHIYLRLEQAELK